MTAALGCNPTRVTSQTKKSNQLLLENDTSFIKGAVRDHIHVVIAYAMGRGSTLFSRLFPQLVGDALRAVNVTECFQNRGRVYGDRAVDSGVEAVLTTQ